MEQGKYQHLQPGDKVVLEDGSKATICTLAQVQSRHPGAHDFSGNDVLLALDDNERLWLGWDNYDGICKEGYSIVSAEIQSTPLNVYLPDNVEATGKRNKHLDLIVLWALHGAKIQGKWGTEPWQEIACPTWSDDMEYRLMPSETEEYYTFTLVDGKPQTRRIEAKDILIGDLKVTKNATGSYLWAVLDAEELDRIRKS